MPEFGDKSPSRAQQHESILLHSPLAVAGMFLFVLRDYFGNHDLHWKWDENKSTSGIIIDTDFNPQTENPDGKPAIYVEKGQTAYGQVVLGDRDQYQPDILTKRLEHFYAIMQTDIILKCVSPRKGESMILGDLVQQYLTCTKGELSRVFAVRNFSPVIMGSTIPYERDERMYNTPVSLRIDLESRWATVPVAPAIRKLAITLTNAGLSINDGFVTMYQHVTGKSNVD